MSKVDQESTSFKRPALTSPASAGERGRREPKVYPREEHTISRRNIDPDALKILYRLMNAGYQAYLVGGGVRDLLLGIEPKDYDIGTNARPKQIRALFSNSRVIGRRFRLVHIYFRGNKIIEVATFRGEGDEEAPLSGDTGTLKKNENIYGTTESDAFRRDLTINALFYDAGEFSVIDYTGGFEDLKVGIIRIIGDPEVRFREDPVRLMRAVRHAARLKFAIEPRTLDALLNNRALIKESSEVRLYEELRKDLGSGCSLDVLRLFAQCGLLEFLIPELTVNDSSLLRSASSLSRALAGGDRLMREGHTISSTAVLACMALFIGGEMQCQPEVRFQYEDELLIHLDGCFTRLAVPKRERERIKEIALLWWKFARRESDPQSFEIERERVPDLEALFYLLPVPDSQADLHNLVRNAVPSGPQGPRRRRGGRSRKRMLI